MNLARYLRRLIRLVGDMQVGQMELAVNANDLGLNPCHEKENSPPQIDATSCFEFNLTQAGSLGYVLVGGELHDSHGVPLALVVVFSADSQHQLMFSCR